MTDFEARRAHLPEAFVREVRARTDLARLIGQDVTLRRHGREYIGLCPFHQERTPSFTVVADRGFYHCFGCGANGDAIRYLEETRGLEFRDAVAELAARAGLPMPDGTPLVAPTTPTGVAAGAPGPARTAGATPAPPPPDRADHVARRERDRARAYELWRAGAALPGTPADVYLGLRGLRPETTATLSGLRFHPAVPYWWMPPASADDAPRARDARPELLGRWPAMLAAIVGPDGRFQAVHRTWIADNGRSKRLVVDPVTGGALPAKKVQGPAGGGCIRLRPLPAGQTVLGAAEGIETAASVIQALDGPGAVVWALYSLGNLCGGGLGQGARHPDRPGRRLPSRAPDPERPGWLPPEGVADVTWWADGDSKDPRAHEPMLRRAAARFAARGVTMRIARPPEGRDWNDVLRDGGASEVA
jgi:hypothetical protein